MRAIEDRSDDFKEPCGPGNPYRRSSLELKARFRGESEAIAIYLSIDRGEMSVRVAEAMDQDEMSEYITRLEQRIEILSKENAALTMTLNKILRENMRLKAENKSLEMRIAAQNGVSEINPGPEPPPE